VQLTIEAGSIPWLDGARDYARGGYLPGGAARNRAYFEEEVRREDGISPDVVDLLFDPETSGGLLLGVPSSKLVAFRDSLEVAGLASFVIGAVEARDGPGPFVVVRGGAYPSRAAEE